jgi:hypothetical protein
MNRNSKMRLAYFIVAIFAFACAGKKDVATQTETESTSWKEMDEFHMLMAETFHPYKDSADLGPAIEKCEDLAAEAGKWAAAPLPKKVDNEEMKANLELLKNETLVLANTVQARDQHAIGAQLTKVHDLFHHIQETWYVAGSDEHHHHEH